MKNTKKCTKCESREILKIEGKATERSGNSITSGWFSNAIVNRYLCTGCGFTEEWIENRDDIEQLKKWYKKDNEL